MTQQDQPDSFQGKVDILSKKLSGVLEMLDKIGEENVKSLVKIVKKQETQRQKFAKIMKERFQRYED